MKKTDHRHGAGIRGKQEIRRAVLSWILCWAASLGGVTLASSGAMVEPQQAGIGRITADHRKFAVLQQGFKTGPEVTRACLSCHTEAARQLHSSIHWTWKWDEGQPGLGKRAALNNF